MVEWSGTVVLTTPRLLLRTFRRDDRTFLGMVFQVVVYAITAELWRSRSPTRN